MKFQTSSNDKIQYVSLTKLQEIKMNLNLKSKKLGIAAKTDVTLVLIKCH